MLKKREKIIFNITAGLVVLSAAMNLIILPVFDEYARLNRQIAESRAKLIRYRQLLSEKNNIKIKYERIFPAAGSGSEREGTPANLLADMENLAAGAGIRIVDMRPGTWEAGGGTDLSLIELKTEGNLEGYVKFIYNIENSLSLMSIKSVQLLARPGSANIDGSFSIYGVCVSD